MGSRELRRLTQSHLTAGRRDPSATPRSQTWVRRPRVPYSPPSPPQRMSVLGVTLRPDRRQTGDVMTEVGEGQGDEEMEDEDAEEGEVGEEELEEEGEDQEEQTLVKILAAAVPQERKQILGMKLFPKIQDMFPDTAGKITGMLLEMDNRDLVHILADQTLLDEKVQEAVYVLRNSTNSRPRVTSVNYFQNDLDAEALLEEADSEAQDDDQETGEEVEVELITVEVSTDESEDLNGTERLETVVIRNRDKVRDEFCSADIGSSTVNASVDDVIATGSGPVREGGASMSVDSQGGNGDISRAGEEEENIQLPSEERVLHVRPQSIGAQLVRWGELQDISAWIHPVFPEVIETDSEDWDAIDGIGVWDCSSTIFQTVDSIPALFIEKWAAFKILIIRKVVQASSEADETRALKWFLISAQVALRKSTRGGKKQRGIGEMAARFDLIHKESWGELLEVWKEDKRKLELKRARRRAGANPEMEKIQLRESAMNLLMKGNVGKAAKRLTSNGVASTEEPAVMEALASKYPARHRELPRFVRRYEPVEAIPSLKDDLLSLGSGVSAGYGGDRNEFWTACARVWSREDFKVFKKFCLKYLGGSLQPWFYMVWNSVLTIALFKDALRDSLRPVGVEASLLRNIHGTVLSSNKQAITEYLEPQQLALSKAGGHRLVHSVRLAMEQNPHFVCVKLDIENAQFNFESSSGRSSPRSGVSLSPRLPCSDHSGPSQRPGGQRFHLGIRS